MWKKGSGLYLFATFSSEHLHLLNPCSRCSSSGSVFLKTRNLSEVSGNPIAKSGASGFGVSNHLLSNASPLLTKQLFRFWFMEVLGHGGNHRIRNEKCGLFFFFLLSRFSPGKNDCGKSVHISSSQLETSFTLPWQTLSAFNNSFEVWRGSGTSNDVKKRQYFPFLFHLLITSSPACPSSPQSCLHPAAFSIPAPGFLPSWHFHSLLWV